MKTISRRATRQIAALKKRLNQCTVYTLHNQFQGAGCDPEHAWKSLDTGLHAKLTDNEDGTYRVHVHANLWYELREAPPEPVTSTPEERHVRVGSPAALVAAVPHLLGFVPERSVVIIGTEGPRGKVKVTLRYDLPHPPDAGIGADIAEHALAVLGSQRLTTAIVVSYGPDELVAPMADALRSSDLPLSDMLRVEDGRYWSYLAPGSPADGTPFDAASQPVDAELAAAEARPVLANREALAATIDPVSGDEAEAMRRATRRAEEHLSRLVQQSGSKAIANEGREAVVEALALYRRGDRFRGALQPAWLTVVLRDLQVRDEMWARMDPDHAAEHRRLLTDLTRRAQPGYIAPPASLLAFVAWQAGNGALANVALDRALADDPHYSMAELLRLVINGGAPPSLARLPMTPEDVVAVYDDRGDDGFDDSGATADVGSRDITRAVRLLFPHPVRLGTRDLGNGEFLLKLPSASAYSLGSERTGWRPLEEFLARHLGHGTQVVTVIRTRVVPLRAGGHDMEFALRIKGEAK